MQHPSTAQKINSHWIKNQTEMNPDWSYTLKIKRTLLHKQVFHCTKCTQAKTTVLNSVISPKLMAARFIQLNVLKSHDPIGEELCIYKTRYMSTKTKTRQKKFIHV